MIAAVQRQALASRDTRNSSPPVATSWLSEMSRGRGLLDCPNELLEMIKESIDEFDLLTHCCYHQLCSRTAGVYARQSDDDFWAWLCWGNGLGKFAWEEHALWEEVALECAEHAWECEHSACGARMLKINRESVDSLQYHAMCIYNSARMTGRGQHEEWI